MGQPNRSAIIADLQTTLAGITIANGYKSNVTTVERVFRDREDARAESTAFPWIGFVVGRQTNAYEPGRQIKSTLNTEVIGHVSASTEEGRTDAVADLEDDIIAALGVDTTRGGYAIHTIVDESESDESQPDAVDSSGVAASVILRIRVVYIRTSERS